MSRFDFLLRPRRRSVDERVAKERKHPSLQCELKDGALFWNRCNKTLAINLLNTKKRLKFQLTQKTILLRDHLERISRLAYDDPARADLKEINN